MGTEHIHEIASNVLYFLGEYLPHRVIRVKAVYQDKKMTIEGILDREGRKFDWIAISINLQQPRPQPASFGIFKNDSPDQTVVHFWQEVTRFHRPGHWEMYLRQLSDNIEVESEEARKQHGKAVDDFRLFSGDE
jgi:hypothetical protein